jgi:thioredoxin 1
MSTEKKSFQELVSASDVPVLVDVYSDTCGPCIAMKPVLAELKQKMGDDVKIIKINGYTNMQFMQDYAIRAFPTLMIFQKGKVVWTREGFTTATMLENMVKAHA